MLTRSLQFHHKQPLATFGVVEQKNIVAPCCAVWRWSRSRRIAFSGCQRARGHPYGWSCAIVRTIAYSSKPNRTKSPEKRAKAFFKMVGFA
jgi:hypothetical protein